MEVEEKLVTAEKKRDWGGISHPFSEETYFLQAVSLVCHIAPCP